jgi:hypothetical protein
MTDTQQGEPRPVFNLRAIGPEPPGATPLGHDDLEGLIPDFVATRADLNVVEFENISKALPWAIRRARALGPEGVLAYGFMMELHISVSANPFTWGGAANLDIDGSGRARYLAALIKAVDTDSYADLVQFARP